jgi:hypothetical protein
MTHSTRKTSGASSGASHALFPEQPDAVASTVIDYLKALA